jgi:peptidyl-prolyl cis-trans isomerase D
MASGIKKSLSQFFVTIFIGFIVISFMFTGYESMKGSPDTVANVGGIPIKYAEYQQEYNRQLEYYKSMLGGNITSQQIEQFNLKKNALNNLIQRNLLIKLSENMGVVAGPSEIKKEIKALPYFKTNEQFDVTKYKNLLSRNSLTPADFEKSIEKQIKTKVAKEVLFNFPISNKYIAERENFRKNAIKATIIQLDKSSLKKLITVSNSEIKKFLAKKTNLTRVQGIFKTKKAGLSQKEQVQANHILLKTTADNEKEVLKKITALSKRLTTKNFIKLANKNTEDSSGKKNGGDLKWFARKAMVPEFEKAAFSAKKNSIVGPVKTKFGYHLIWVRNKKEKKEATLKAHKNIIAKDLIATEKATKENLKILSAKVTTELKADLATNNKRKLEKSKAKYGYNTESKVIINRLDGISGNIKLNADDLRVLFSKPLITTQTFVFDNATQITLLRGQAHSPKPTDVKAQKNNLKNKLGNQLSQKIIDNLKETVSLKIYDRLL